MLHSERPKAKERGTDAGERPLFGPGVNVGPEVEVGVGVGPACRIGPLKP